MADQSLDNDEQLNVRWAYEDPNPRAQAAKLRNHAVQMLAAMADRGHLASIDVTHDDACALYRRLQPVQRRLQPVHRRLQPRASEAATPCSGGCNPVEPQAVKTATLCTQVP